MRFIALSLALLIWLLPVSVSAQQDDTDRGYIQGLLEDALSAEGRTVRIEGFAGALSSVATIERLTVTDPDGVWLSAEDLALSWNRSALVRGRIEISEISIGKIDLPRAPLPAGGDMPSPEARGAFSLPELPVSVDIAQMQIDEAVIGAPLLGQEARFAFSGRAQLDGSAGDAELQLQRLDKPGEITLSGAFDNGTRVLALDLSLQEPENGIAANLIQLPGRPSVVLSVQGDAPLSDFEANVRLATDGQDRLSGTVALAAGDDGATRFDADISGDIAPMLLPDYAEFLGDDVSLVAQGAQLADGGFDLSQLSLGTAALQLNGAARIAADGWPERLSLTGQINPPEGNSVVLPLAGPPTSVQGAELSLQFNASAGEAWELRTNVLGLERLDMTVAAMRLAGSGAISRTDQSVTGALQLALDQIAMADQALAKAVGDSLRGSLSFDWQQGAPLALRAIALQGADYGLTGAVSFDGVGSDAPITITPQVQLNAADLTRFDRLAGVPLAGAADLAIEGRVEPLTGLLDLNFNGATRNIQTGIAQLDPLLRGAGRLAMQVVRDTEGLRLTPVQIETDHARINATADLATGASRLSAVAALPEIRLVVPQLRGPVQLDVIANQDASGWAIQADAELPGGTDARFDGRIDGDGRDSLTATGVLNADVQRLSAFSELAGRALTGAVTARATGTADLLTRSFDLEATGQASGVAAGIPEPAGTLLRGALQFDLAASGNAQGQISLRRAVLTTPAARASVQGQIGQSGSALEFDMRVNNVATLFSDLSGAATLRGTAQKVGNSWQVVAQAAGPQGIGFQANARVAPDASAVNGRLTGQVPLGLLNGQLPGQALSGLARVDLGIAGPPRLDALSGRISISDGRFSDPARNLTLSGLRGQADLVGGRAELALQAGVATGGSLRARGPITLSAPFNADIAVDLQGVTLRDASLYEASLGGRVTLQGALQGGARIGGQIDVQTAEVRIPEIGPSYSVLNGLRHLNPSAGVKRTLRFSGLDKPAQPQARGPGYPLDLTINAPARIFVRGRGLDAELGGSLRLTGSSNDIVPVGGFNLIRGRLDLLGRRLTLTEGSVVLRGSFDPVIRFAASTQVDDVTVSLALEGLASAPELTVSSIPELPEEEVLSLLLFGREATQISAFQAVQLAAAIRTLSGRGGDGIAGRLREGLGVDDLDFSTDADGTAQASVGKYIADGVYTDLTVKSDGTSQINLNLDISPTVKLRGRVGSDGDSGLGLFFEKDY